VVFVPKYRKKSIFGQLRKQIGGVLRKLSEQEGVELVEGHAMADHVHFRTPKGPSGALHQATGSAGGS